MNDPQGVEAERRTLGALLMASAPLRLVSDNGITADLFADPGHRAIFGAVLTTAAAEGTHATVDIGDVIVALDAGSQLELAGGPPYLHHLLECVATDRNIANDVRRVRHAAARRTALVETERAAARLRSGGDLAEVVDDLVGSLKPVRDRTLDAAVVPFVRTPIADVLEAMPPPPSYWWDGLVPAGAVTLWSGHGGSAKSFILLMLGAAIASGRSLFGVETRTGRVAYFSAEDAPGVTRHRLAMICKGMDLAPDVLADRLHVLDATVADPVLYHDQPTKAGHHGATTATFQALHNFMAAEHIDVLIVDNASDTYSASEIDRAKVRAFMRALVRLVPEHGAVVLAAHVDKGTSRGDRSGFESYSGSTAWHNSARSRIAQTRDKDGAITLDHQKSNYGQLHDPIRLVWPIGGLPQIDTPFSPIVQGIVDRNHTTALLRLVAEFSERGEHISTLTNSRTHAGKLLRGQAGFPPRLSDVELFNLLREAERRGLLARTNVRSKGRGHEKEVWTLTPAGRHAAGLAPSAPSAPTSGVGAVVRSGAEAAPTAPTPAPGGVGGMGARDVGAESTP